MDLETLKTHYRDGIIHLAEQYKLENVRVFGSTVRGSSRADSDIDLLVHLKKGCSLLDISAFEVEVSKLTGSKIDVLDDVAIKPILAHFILAEAVAV